MTEQSALGPEGSCASPWAGDWAEAALWSLPLAMPCMMDRKSKSEEEAAKTADWETL